MTEFSGKKLQNVSIITRGSRGDIQPYVAIALALREQLNCSIRILTNENFGPFIESFAGINSGITHVPIFDDLAKPLREDPLLVKAQNEGDTASLIQLGIDEARTCAPKMCRLFFEEMNTHPPDLLICGVEGEYYSLYASTALNIPTINIVLSAFTPNPKRAPLGFPTLPFGLHDYLLFTVQAERILKSWKYLDDAMEALPGGQRIMNTINWKASKHLRTNPLLPVVICKSQLFQPILNPGIHENFKFVGAAIIEKKHEATSSFGGDKAVFDKLSKFIDSDPDRKPVYMGWGSMRCKSPEHMVVLAADALRKSNQRGIILGGWAQLSLTLLETSTEDADLISYAKTNIWFVDKAPHEWLMPQMAAVVHHGGAGTTNASMRSGVPTIITPIFLDQFDHAYLVEELGVGVGFSKQFQKISADELAKAITKVTAKDGHYSKTAKALSAKLLQEGGASAVVAQVEKYWSGYVTTGVWESARNQMLKTESEKEPNYQTGTILAAVGLIGVLGAVMVAN